MRPIMHGDVVAAACVLLPLPCKWRAGWMHRLIGEAEAADCYRKETGRGHPEWGNGSLMAAARRYRPIREPMLDDSEYCQCMALVLDMLVAWRANPSGSNATFEAQLKCNVFRTSASKGVII